MLLYHGTAGIDYQQILNEGLKPRGKRKGNWKHSALSNANAVYLSRCYAPHFMMTAGQHLREPPTTGLLIEVESDRLGYYQLLPDEDCLEQVMRGHDEVKGTQRARTLWYRNNLRNYVGAGANGVAFWEMSVRQLGNCCYYGAIPPSAITRIAVVDLAKHPRLRFDFDLSVVLANHRIMGDTYHWRTRCLFGDERPDDGKEDEFHSWQIACTDVHVMHMGRFGEPVGSQKVTREAAPPKGWAKLVALEKQERSAA